MISSDQGALGLPVAAHAAARAQREPLYGRLVDIVPLDPASHEEDLYRVTHGERQDELWRYLSIGPFSERAEFARYLRTAAAKDDPLLFTIVEKEPAKAAGLAAYLRITPVHRVIEVGHILFSPSLQRTPAAAEAMYLMAKHAFEDLGYRRYEWKCDALNAPSRNAALRLGFVFEGIFRQHMVVKGRNRDTAWFSMLDSEWPACKVAFEGWLDPSNFDANGKQLRSLASLRFNRQYGDCIR
jgi:RimJ/RimL family protein N-acetyltransferase